MTEENRETAKEEANPFKDFNTEVYDQGELVVEPADPAKDADEDLPAKEEQDPPAKEGDAGERKEGEQTPPAKEGEQPPKKKQSVQERINELTKNRREAERRAESAEARERELLARLNATPPKDEPKDLPKDKPAADEEDPNAPKSDDYEYGDLDPRYIRAIATYEATKVFTEQRRKDQEERTTTELSAKQEKAREQFGVMLERGSKVNEDFYEKVVIGAEKGEWPLSTELGELALASDVGDAVLYHLATNPEEAEKIHRSTPLEQARAFGRLEVQFSAGRAAASGETGKPAPKTPKAPPPLEVARGAGGKSEASADTDDFSSFEARANTKG